MSLVLLALSWLVACCGCACVLPCGWLALLVEQLESMAAMCLPPHCAHQTGAHTLTVSALKAWALLVHVQVVLCSACSGHGFKMSSVIGEQLARMVLGSGSKDDRLHEAMAMHRLDASRPGHAEVLADFDSAL